MYMYNSESQHKHLEANHLPFYAKLFILNNKIEPNISPYTAQNVHWIFVQYFGLQKNNLAW